MLFNHCIIAICIIISIVDSFQGSIVDSVVDVNVVLESSDIVVMACNSVKEAYYRCSLSKPKDLSVLLVAIAIPVC